MRMILTICIMLTAPTTSVLADNVIDEGESPQFLFVISAVSGSCDGETLTLTGVPSVVYFSNRPYRIAGHINLEEFEEIWIEGVDNFMVDPPNATLSIFDSNGNENVVVELSDLHGEGSTLTFTVRALTGDAPASFGTASLFVDIYQSYQSLQGGQGGDGAAGAF